MENELSKRRVARDLANSILKNRISEFEKLDVEFLTKKYNLVFNEELRLYFIPDSPRGRSGILFPRLPDDVLSNLVERNRADENTINLPVWIGGNMLVVKDKKHYLAFTQQGDGKTIAIKVEGTVANKSKLESQLNRKLTGITKYVIPRRAAISLCEKYLQQDKESK